MDNKLTDNEIIKALECCISDDKGIHEACRNCPLQGKNVDCPEYIRASALDLINRQKAEIERYKGVIKLLENDVKTAKDEAIKDCIRRLKQIERQKGEYGYVTLADLDKVKKEMTEGGV